MSSPVVPIDPLKKTEIFPVDEEGPDWVSLKRLPHPPAVSFSVLVAFVSPVSVKKNSPKCEPGRKTPFSGRLNGVAFAAFAATFALNGVVPSAAVSCTVTQRVAKLVP